MQGLTELLRPLIDEGLSERTLSAAHAECLRKACEGEGLCGWLILAAVLGIAESAVSDRAVTAQQAHKMEAALYPVLRRLLSAPSVTVEELCEIIGSQPDLVRQIVDSSKT